MKTMSFVFLLVASMALVLTGCSDNLQSLVAPTGQHGGNGLAKSTVVHEKIEIPVDYVAPDPAGCLPGLVHVTGHVTINLQMVFDANGDLKLNAAHINATHLTLTTESGLVYNINEIDKEMYTFGEANTMTIMGHATVTTPGGGVQVHLGLHSRVTVTPDGKATGSVETITFRCE